MSALTVDARHALLLDMARHNEELSPRDRQRKLAEYAPTVAANIRFRLFLSLVDQVEWRSMLLPGSDDIPGGYDSRAAADIAVEQRDTEIEHLLTLLVPYPVRTSLAVAS